MFLCLIWFFTSQSTFFQLCLDGSSWAEPVLSKDSCVLLKDTTMNQQKIDNYVISGSLKNVPMGKLITEYQVCVFWYHITPGSASRVHDDLLCKPRESTSVLEALPGKLHIKRYLPSILYLLLLLCVEVSIIRLLSCQNFSLECVTEK